MLLVDADLRRPSLHTYFTLNRSRGLVQVLKDMLPVAHVIQGTPIENLDLIAAGPDVSNPAELLASPRFATFLGEVRQSHDTIIIDSSPLLAVADPLIIGSVADGVILIARVEIQARSMATPLWCLRMNPEVRELLPVPEQDAMLRQAGRRRGHVAARTSDRRKRATLVVGGQMACVRWGTS